MASKRIHGVTWLLIQNGCVVLEKCPNKARVLRVGEWFVPGATIVDVNNGVKARVWEGETPTGIKVVALITRVAIHVDDAARAPEFERELQEQKPPTALMSGVYEARMFLP